MPTSMANQLYCFTDYLHKRFTSKCTNEWLHHNKSQRHSVTTNINKRWKVQKRKCDQCIWMAWPSVEHHTPIYTYISNCSCVHIHSLSHTMTYFLSYILSHTHTHTHKHTHTHTDKESIMYPNNNNMAFILLFCCNCFIWSAVLFR